MSAPPVELAFVALGSNIEPEEHLVSAVEALQALGTLHSISRVYRSKPVGDRQQPDFLNAAALLEVPLSPRELRDQLRTIEVRLGRVRTEDKYAARTIDLDLVLFGQRVDPSFPLPDPEITTQAHLAIPLAELDPEFNHPVKKEPLGQVAERLRATAELELRPEVSLKLEEVRVRG